MWERRQMPAAVVPALDTAHGELGSRDRLQHTPGGGTVRRATGLSGVQRLQLLGSSVFKCKTSRIGPSGPWPSGGSARSSSRSLATPDSSPGSIGPTDSSLTSVHRYAW